MGSDQRFSLKWNNYQTHLVTAFESLLGDNDFIDVTLGVEGRRLSAHKMLLSACSPYFRELLKGNPCQHPIIVLRDIRYNDLHSLLQFMYNGEVNVAQDQLNSFLKSAEALKIRGLTDNNDDIDDVSTDESKTADSSVRKKRTVSDVSSGVQPPTKRQSVPARRLSDHKNLQPVKQEVIDINEDQDQFEDRTVQYDGGDGGGGGGQHQGGVVDQYLEGGGYDEGTLAVPDGRDVEQTQEDQGWGKGVPTAGTWKGGGGPGDWDSMYPGPDISKPTWFCEICNKTFSNGGAWYNHKKFHTGETVCKVCSKIMGTVSSLNRHIKNEHADSIGQPNSRYAVNS